MPKGIRGEPDGMLNASTAGIALGCQPDSLNTDRSSLHAGGIARSALDDRSARHRSFGHTSVRYRDEDGRRVNTV
jgi:hypothetical protein